ncbi:Hypothetical protein CAP_4846 [Chondromyces apiculatus DSM 436]|uniref:Uncharacterized protein n=1 Tax=Chondromyces apiculatus DSM 436 TaxID=1192034 RepID=A0A017T4I2_9BACT|nr:Hypothetical protein CAP_4846 [Chondromyces apiculatus DSM 436]
MNECGSRFAWWCHCSPGVVPNSSLVHLPMPLDRERPGNALTIHSDRPPPVATHPPWLRKPPPWLHESTNAAAGIQALPYTLPEVSRSGSFPPPGQARTRNTYQAAAWHP